MVYRTFFCLNTYCRHQFTVVDQDHPSCPRCEGTQVKWLPVSIAVKSQKTQAADAAVKDLVTQYGDKNFNSPVRGERAQPRMGPAAVAGRSRKFMPVNGWGIDLPENANGQLDGNAYCAPTGVTVKGKLHVGNSAPAFQAAASSPTATGSVPVVEASHRGEISR